MRSISGAVEISMGLHGPRTTRGSCTGFVDASVSLTMAQSFGPAFHKGLCQTRDQSRHAVTPPTAVSWLSNPMPQDKVTASGPRPSEGRVRSSARTRPRAQVSLRPAAGSGHMPSAAPSRTWTHAHLECGSAVPGRERTPTFVRDRTLAAQGRASPRLGRFGNYSWRLYGRTGSKGQALNTSLSEDVERRNERP